MLSNRVWLVRTALGWATVMATWACTANARGGETQAPPRLYKPSIAVDLPYEHNTPDGMTLDGQGNILLSCPNFNTNAKGNEVPAWIVKITPDDKLEKFFQMPVHPQTGRACPLGNAMGADGNLYIADCQALGGDKNYMSRLQRIVIRDGKPVRCETVVEGFVMANAVAAYKDQIFVTETAFEPESGPGPHTSGVYRFAIAELSAEKPLRLARGGTDRRVCFRLETKNEKWKVGANGLGFAPDGTMYVCNFGDAQLIAVQFDKQGNVAASKVVAEGGPIKSTDGLKVDPETGGVYIADFLGNAVHRVDPKSGKVTVLAQNGLTDGRKGELDKCSEVCLRGKRLYVANIDLNLDGNTFDKPYTVSVIDLSRAP